MRPLSLYKYEQLSIQQYKFNSVTGYEAPIH